MGAMEATIFTGWIYDFLMPHAVALKVAHPEMLKAITAAKKKNDRADFEKIADLLRVNLLPECTMMPKELRELRRILRYRNMVVRTAVKMKNKISGLLMEVGAGGGQATPAWKEVFPSVAGAGRRRARLGKGVAAPEPRQPGTLHGRSKEAG